MGYPKINAKKTISANRLIALARPTTDLLFLLFGVSLLTFCLMELAPGDPAEILLSSRFESPAPEQVAAMREAMGLTDPFWIRYLRWLKNALCLDLGHSYRTGDPVVRELGARIPATGLLAVFALGFVMLFSLISGIIGAFYQDRLPDRLTQLWAIFSVSVPDYWLGLLAIYFFSVYLNLLPSMGNSGPCALVLPVLTLGLSVTAVQGRVLRASLLEVLGQDYIRFARMKGLGAFAVLRRHVLKNAILPVLSLWGICLGHLLGGTVIVETVFAWPGIGKLTVDAVLDRDFPLVQGAVLFMAASFVLVSKLTDMLYRWLNPRIAS